MSNYSWKYQIIVPTSTVMDDSVTVLLTIATISVITIIIIPRNHSVTLQWSRNVSNCKSCSFDDELIADLIKPAIWIICTNWTCSYLHFIVRGQQPLPPKDPRIITFQLLAADDRDRFQAKIVSKSYFNQYNLNTITIFVMNAIIFYRFITLNAHIL